MRERDLGLAPDEDLIVAGSTHAGEEEIVARIYKELVGKFPRLRVLIAPRHIERTEAVESLMMRCGLESVRVSRLRGEAPGAKRAVLLLDTIGQLRDTYAYATIVFMGGSLIKKGGHNLVEPALHARAIVFGPHMFNFRDMSELFIRHRAAVRVDDEGGLFRTLDRLLDNAEEREALGRNAKRLVESNSGATERTMNVIKEVFGSS
jgi:3-deoxy-D-manno-octulosonic-acid transferase